MLSKTNYVYSGDEEYNDDDNASYDLYHDVDCEYLTSYYWEDMYKDYLSDGAYHEHVDDGCYKHKIYKYDE